MTLLWWLLLACPRQPQESLVLDRDDPLAPDTTAGLVVQPGSWTDGKGLGMTIPEGWVGESGPAEGGLRLSLQHGATGTRLLVWSFRYQGSLAPRPRESCKVTFADDDSYRTVPALTPAGVYTCVLDRGEGATVQTWYGQLADREVHLEAFLRPGATLTGRRALDPLLRSVRRGPRDGIQEQ